MMKNLTRIIIGTILIACGVIYILGAFDVIDMNISFDGWWALFIIVPSISGLITSRDKIWNAFCLLLGIYLLLAAQGVIEYAIGFKLSVPIIIILLGIKLIVKSASPQKKIENIEKGQKEHVTAFSSQTIDFTDEEITVAKIGAVFGGVKCNLTDAKIKDGSRLDLFCAFGGADIIVPENVNVKVNTFCLFGGISYKRTIKSVDKDGVTLTITGFCIFGGADIK